MYSIVRTPSNPVGVGIHPSARRVRPELSLPVAPRHELFTSRLSSIFPLTPPDTVFPDGLLDVDPQRQRRSEQVGHGIHPDHVSVDAVGQF